MTDLSALFLEIAVAVPVVLTVGYTIRRNKKTRAILSDGFFHHSNTKHQLRSDTMTLRNDLIIKAEAVKKLRIEDPTLSVRAALEKINDELRGQG